MLLSPATAVMNRLKYPQKFALISLLLTLPAGWTLWQYVSEIDDRIAFAEKELQGEEVVESVLDVEPGAREARPMRLGRLAPASGPLRFLVVVGTPGGAEGWRRCCARGTCE